MLPRLTLALTLITPIARAGTDCVAHRGDNAHHLENSIASLESAARMGADGVEFDVRHSSDGIPFLLHDAKLKRTARSRQGESCPLKTKVAQIPWTVIESSCELSDGQPIPTLDAALEALAPFSATPYVELEDPPTRLTREALARHFPDGAVVIAFSKRNLNDLGWDAARRYHRGFWWSKWKKFDGGDVMRASKGLVKRATRADKTIGAWTIDKPKKMTKLAERGVGFITTNDPKACLELLR